MIRARRWIYNKATSREVDSDSRGNQMVMIPPEHQEFFRNNKQVVCPDQRIRFMTLEAIRKEVIVGRADDWEVIDFDFDTGEATLVCVYCVTNVEHPGSRALSVNPASADLSTKAHTLVRWRALRSRAL
jgi:hypothetical protein